ncbi:MAG: hypothetical protein ACRDWY_06030, partial [Actinomycetes bacterium]
SPKAGLPAVADGRPFLPYSADSFFRSTLQDAPVDRAATRSFRVFMRAHSDQDRLDYPVIRGVGANRWGTVYAEGRASDPVWRLAGRVPPEVSVLRREGFHAPEWLGEALTRTSDSPFVVVDRASGWSIWGAKARDVGGNVIRVGAAGLFEHDSNGLDLRNPLADSRVNFRSRGAIPDAMVIRRDLMAYAQATNGDLGHVLHMFFVETDSSAGHVHPMVGEESGKHGWGAAGTRIAVGPDVDLSRRDCSPAALVIARTLQRHGTYLGDNASQGAGLKAEQETDAASWEGTLSEDEMEGCIRWNDFVVIEAGWQ